MATTENATATSASPFPIIAPFANPEWLKSFTETPIKFYSSAWNQMLGFSASCLQDQADYVQKLSECSNPAEALKCHGDFARKTWERSCDQNSKMMDTIRTSFSFELPHK